MSSRMMCRDKIESAAVPTTPRTPTKRLGGLGVLSSLGVLDGHAWKTSETCKFAAAAGAPATRRFNGNAEGQSPTASAPQQVNAPIVVAP
jgi:hypothetical protein